jgi:hypothetical protein
MDILRLGLQHVSIYKNKKTSIPEAKEQGLKFFYSLSSDL